MFTRNFTVFANILPLIIIIMDLKCGLSMPRVRYRTYRSKGPPFPPILQFSPPRLTSPPNFQNEYASPPWMNMNMNMNSPPKPGYDQPPNMDYDQPNNGLQLEYGPPTTMDTKPVIHKHIYVHIPPTEPDSIMMRPPLTTVAPQKHYRIVFIKAPTEAPVTYPTIPLQPLDEEKTLVYVLVKKPEPLPQLILPKPSTTVPTKPEVYFIRYKTQKDVSDDAYTPPSLNDGPYPASNSNDNSFPPNDILYPPSNSNDGPYPPSISNDSPNNIYPSTNYPPNNTIYPPNTSYGPPQTTYSSPNPYQTTSATLGPPLAPIMIKKKTIKNKK